MEDPDRHKSIREITRRANTKMGMIAQTSERPKYPYGQGYSAEDEDEVPDEGSPSSDTLSPPADGPA